MPSGALALAGLAALLGRLPWCHRDEPEYVSSRNPPVPAVESPAPHDESTARVSPGTEPAPAPPPRGTVRIRLLDDVVIRALDERQPAFLRCFQRAQRTEGLGPTTVTMHLEVDMIGLVSTARNDAESLALRACVNAVAMRLEFDEPGRPAEADVPLMFR